MLHSWLSEGSWPGVSSPCLPVAAASPHRREGHSIAAKRSATAITCLHRDQDHGTQRRRRRRKIHDFPRSHMTFSGAVETRPTVSQSLGSGLAQ